MANCLRPVTASSASSRLRGVADDREVGAVLELDLDPASTALAAAVASSPYVTLELRRAP